MRTRQSRFPDIPDFSENEKLKMEKEGMGFYISGHPLKRHTKLIKKYATATTRSLQSANGATIIAGMLTSVNITRTKKGAVMARGVIEDLEGSAPIVFFPQCYSDFSDVIVDDKAVVVKAKVNGSAENGGGESENMQVDLIAEEVYPIEKAESVLAKRIILKLPREAKADDIRALKDVISGCKGSCQVSFEINTEEALVSIDAGKEYMVTASSEILARLGEIIGPSRVELQ